MLRCCGLLGMGHEFIMLLYGDDSSPEAEFLVVMEYHLRLCAGRRALIRSSTISCLMIKTVIDVRKWQCIVCGFIYDEESGLPEEGIPPGTRWEDIPDDWMCPECGVGKEDFEMIEIA